MSASIAAVAREPASAALDAPATTASYPPLARGSMIARPWELHPFRAWLRRLGRPGVLSGAANAGLPWQRVARQRRIALGLLVFVPALCATRLFAGGLASDASDWLAWIELGLFGALSAWVLAGFWTGVMGFITVARGRDSAGISAADVRGRPIDPRARTAIVMPICNEHVPTVFAGLRSTCESLAATGAAQLFDFFILSDTNDPDLRTAEAAAWNDLVDATGGRGRIFYRWRPLRTRRKAGNVADFCRRWGRNYRYMVVLDADSVMSGECLTTLVRLMETHPDAGIIQTAPKAVGCDTLHARAQQFAARVSGTLFSVGMQYWQLGESHYWGHNAIIRVRPFMQHCGLARLPGRGALAGEIMSHDFIEAALMRRAGFHVWLVPDLGGSYEQVPPNLLTELQRDRRWCHGNLQNFRLFLEPGLHPVHRAMLAAGAFAYAAAPLWLAFTLLSTLGAASYASPLTLAALSNPSMLVLLVTMAALLIVPKVLAVVAVFLRNEQHRYGGGLRLIASACLEFAMSTLYAPIRMVFHTGYVLSILAGRHGGWQSPPREEAGTPWREALRRHGGHALLALAWFLAVFEADAGRAWWLLPLLCGLMLAVPLSVLGSRAAVGRYLRERGVLLIPEERGLPDVLCQARRHLARPYRLPSFARALFEPGVNFLLRAASGRRAAAWGMKAARARERAHAALRTGLPKAERLRLLNDPYALSLVYRLSTAGVPA
ncbi:MAG TPA: glucans biosynthesis glucosyltransferase MdoH [Burkholderiaceae bacterium]|nr:glucans biosynthesis glucosyltransferase MdoH [Burkholderiaceae bacterium]